MESIGTMAGGISHDFNNILTPIMGYTEMAANIALNQSDNTMTNFFDQIRSASSRAKDLVSQILTFSRQENQELQLISMQPILKEAIKLLRSSIPATVEIKQDICQHCGIFNANPTQIHQIIMNLCTNAYHAMRETGGVLSVKLRSVAISKTDISQSELPISPGSS